MSDSQGRKLKEALIKNNPLKIVGTINAYSALLAEKEGHEAIYLSGGGVAASSLGVPDLGISSLQDVLIDVERITNVTSIPLLVDADTGWGGAFNIARTVKSFINYGAAGLHIEDQVSQKRCGHRPNKEIVSTGEMIDRIKAAVDASKMNNKDILVMARTDAIATRGLDDAIKRMQKFSELGADILFVEAIKSKEDMKRVIKEVPGHHMINLIEDGETPLLEMNELEDMGFKIAVFPLTLMSASVKIMQESLKNMKNKTYNTNVSKFSDLRDIVGFNEYYEIEDKYK